MSRDPLLYLEDMLQSARKVRRYTRGMSAAEFSKEEIVIDAVLRNLEVMGEATKNLPEDFKQRYHEVDWRGMARFRDFVAHYYFGVKLDTIWDIVVSELPQLLPELERIMEREQ